MRQVQTVAMQVFSDLRDGPFTLEPYEAGWASEAIAMVYVHEVSGPAPTLELQAQISVDGVRWIDHRQGFEPIHGPGGYYLRLDGFGNWLRLGGQVRGGAGDGTPTLIADFYWVCKE